MIYDYLMIKPRLFVVCSFLISIFQLTACNDSSTLIISIKGDGLVEGYVQDERVFECKNSCNSTTNAATTLIATPDDGAKFIEWRGDAAEVCGTDPVCLLDISTTQVTQIVAVFSAGNDAVSIPDANFRSELKAIFNRGQASITIEDFMSLSTLEIRNANISSIEGLQYAKNLTKVNFYGNNISDINPVKHLTKLQTLNMIDNKISDLSPLHELSRKENMLFTIKLDRNLVSDFSSAVRLSKLTMLHLSYNKLSNLNFLNGSGVNLSRLDIRFNNISDASPLVNANIDTIYMVGNPLSSTSCNSHIPAIENQGREITHSCN